MQSKSEAHHQDYSDRVNKSRSRALIKAAITARFLESDRYTDRYPVRR